MSKLSKAVRALRQRCTPYAASNQQARPAEPNEAINLSKGVIFIAIPKTGTTTVRDQLGRPANPIIPNPHLSIAQVRDLMYPMMLRAAMGTNRTFPSDDMPTNTTVREQAKALFDELFKFSGVRNPWARAVSLWKRKEGVRSGGSMNFDAFVERHTAASDTCLHPTRHSCQLDWLCDETGRVLMDYVYKVEELGAAIEEIRNRTDGRLRLRDQRLNANPRSASGRYRDLYTDHTRKLIATRFERDIDHFKYTF